MTKRVLLSVLFLAVCAAATPVVPAPCTAGKHCPSDRLWVLDPTGAQVYSKSVAEDQENPNALYYIPKTDLVDRSMYGKPIVLLEGPDFVKISDAVGVVFAGGNYYLGFKSAGETGAVTLGTGKATFMDETDAPVVVTQFLDRPLRIQGYTAYFRSDVAEEPQVPELATAVLICSGLFLMAGLRRRLL